MGEAADEWAARGRTNLWGTVPAVVEMQSEGGAAGALHGALQAGALATTFTSSLGLLLMLPETRAWHRERLEDGAFVTYKLLLEETRKVRGRCYWSVEALADGKPWRRFYVTPDGKSVLKQPLPR